MAILAWSAGLVKSLLFPGVRRCLAQAWYIAGTSACRVQPHPEARRRVRPPGRSDVGPVEGHQVARRTRFEDGAFRTYRTSSHGASTTRSGAVEPGFSDA